jgi:AraC family transcriptional regulator, regulatory protein of adaptative response / DNA-3-methyladenine glycosylase II
MYNRGMALDEARLYRGILEKDLRLDGTFFSGILTTGVYCRVVCPVPRPAKRENIRFFASAAAAEDAGFRPCMRCRPERSAGTPLWGNLPSELSSALALIADGALDDQGVEDLAGRVGFASRHLRRLFQEHLGASPVAIAKARRTHFARRLIDETDLPVTEIAFASGFRSVRQFNQDLRATFGQPPSELRRRGPRRRPPAGASVEIRLPYRPPLDWPRMIGFLQARLTPGVEVAEHDRYRRLVEFDGVCAAIEIQLVPAEPHLLLRAWMPSSDGLIRVAERARRIFDLAADPLTIGAHLEQSPLLRRLVQTRPGLRVPQVWDPFELAVRAVLGQQVTVRAATTLTGRLVHNFGKPAEGIDLPGLTHRFPTPAALAEADLRAIGATGAQSRAVRALARAVADGELMIEAGRGLEEFVGRICELPGVGQWTAQYIAMRALAEPDAFPAGDLGLRRSAGRGGPILTAGELDRMAEAWRPWRACAAMYLWTDDRLGRPSPRRRRDA